MGSLCTAEQTIPITEEPVPIKDIVFDDKENVSMPQTSSPIDICNQSNKTVCKTKQDIVNKYMDLVSETKCTENFTDLTPNKNTSLNYHSHYHNIFLFEGEKEFFDFCIIKQLHTRLLFSYYDRYIVAYIDEKDNIIKVFK